MLTLQQIIKLFIYERHMRKALLAVLIYFLITQLLTGVVSLTIALIVKTYPWGGMSVDILAPTMMASFIIAILICWRGLKVMRIPEAFRPTNLKWGWSLTAIFACILGAFAGNLFSEVTELPNMIEDMILTFCYNPWGILAVAVMGPIAEELLFREGLCGYLARNGMDPWKAVWVSGILFGLIHVNPAQVFFAAIFGIMLGVIYIKTGNIVLTSIIHILNNSLAIIEARYLGDKILDFSIVEWVGGKINAGIYIIVGFAICAYLLRRLWEKETLDIRLKTLDETGDNYQR